MTDLSSQEFGGAFSDPGNARANGRGARIYIERKQIGKSVHFSTNPSVAAFVHK